MVVYTWWCWHICEGEEVGVETDELGEEKEVTMSDRMLASARPMCPVKWQQRARDLGLVTGRRCEE